MHCYKSGIRIHESNNNNTPGYNDHQLDFYNKIKSQNKHTGVRIENSKNEYAVDPFDGINPIKNPYGEKPVDTISHNKTTYNEIDLNIDNYSQRELYKLFGITTQQLNEDILKISKKIVLKTHPDKSNLDPKYFLFFSKAYKRLYAIYEFQNKTARKQTTEYNKEENANAIILDKMFEQNKSLKNSGDFNKWFNEKFEKHKVEEEDSGYGDWLQSEQDFLADLQCKIISKADMPGEIEKHKKRIQALTTYNGFDTQYASTFGGSSLINSNSNYTSSGIFSNDGVGYTDLKQAYVESVIPVTEDDYKKMPKFNSIDEYNRYRDSVDTKPLDKEVALKKLYEENKQQEEQSVALAYYYAQQSERVKQKSDSFWSDLKQLTN